MIINTIGKRTTIEIYKTAVDGGGDTCPDTIITGTTYFAKADVMYTGQRAPLVGDYLVYDFDLANAKGISKILCKITSIDRDALQYGANLAPICFMGPQEIESSGGGTEITINGVKQDSVDMSDITGIPKYDMGGAGNPTVEIVLGDEGYVEFGKMRGVGRSLGGGEHAKTDVEFQFPIAGTSEVEPSVITSAANRKRLGFKLTNTFKKSIAPQVAINAPTTATNGQLSEADLATLQGNNNAYILFNNEIYRLQDNQHDVGFLTYTHVGYDNTVNDYIIKCITITVSTRGWVLTSAKVIPQRPEGTTNALVGFDSTNNLQYFNIGDGLSVEGNTLKGAKFYLSGTTLTITT